MEAAVGDRISTPGRHVGDAARSGLVIEVRGHDKAPLYLVRWDDGHEGVCSPGPETRVERRPDPDVRGAALRLGSKRAGQAGDPGKSIAELATPLARRYGRGQEESHVRWRAGISRAGLSCELLA